MPPFAAIPEESATITILLRAGIAASALGAGQMTPAPHLPCDGRRASVVGRTGELLPERDATTVLPDRDICCRKHRLFFDECIAELVGHPLQLECQTGLTVANRPVCETCEHDQRRLARAHGGAVARRRRRR